MHHRTLYHETYVSFTVAGDVTLLHKHCSSNTQYFCIFDSFNNKQTGHIVVFPLLKWLRERTTILRYTCEAYIVLHLLINLLTGN